MQFNSGSRNWKTGYISEMAKNLVSLGTGPSTLSLTINPYSLLSNTVEGCWQVTIRSYPWFYCSFSLVPGFPQHPKYSWPLRNWATTLQTPDVIFYFITSFLVIHSFAKLGNKYNPALGAVSNYLPCVHTLKWTNKKVGCRIGINISRSNEVTWEAEETVSDDFLVSEILN